MILVFLWVFSRSNYSRELVHALWRAGLPRLRRREIGALFRHPKRGQIWLWINTYKNTIFSGMNIHKSQLFSCSPGVQGFDTLPYPDLSHLLVVDSSCARPLQVFPEVSQPRKVEFGNQLWVFHIQRWEIRKSFCVIESSDFPLANPHQKKAETCFESKPTWGCIPGNVNGKPYYDSTSVIDIYNKL